MHIAVVGGSVAGSALAVLLGRAGHSVTVYERSSGELKGRGAGLSMPSQLMELLIDQDLLDTDTESVRPRDRVWCVADGRSPTGRTIATQRMVNQFIRYGQLYQNLNRRADGVEYRTGAELVSLGQDFAKPRVITRAGDDGEYDVVVGADGYGSTVRRILFPSVRPEYAGYPAWRGVADIPDADAWPVVSSLQSPCIRRGHGNFYLVPPDDPLGRGMRRVNWLIYDGGAPAELLGMADTSSSSEVHSVAPGRMTQRQLSYLHDLAKDQLPPWHAGIVLQTREPYVQPLYDLEIERYARGRVCLIGDAATVARPHTGSGASKALQDALALSLALKEASDPDYAPVALERYSVDRAEAGNRLVALGRQLGRDQVTGAPDWTKLDQESFHQWADATSTNSAYYVSRS